MVQPSSVNVATATEVTVKEHFNDNYKLMMQVNEKHKKILKEDEVQLQNNIRKQQDIENAIFTNLMKKNLSMDEIQGYREKLETCITKQTMYADILKNVKEKLYESDKNTNFFEKIKFGTVQVLEEITTTVCGELVVKYTLPHIHQVVDCLEVGLSERQDDFVVNEDHNFCNEEDTEISSSLSELDKVCVVKLDHNFFEDGYDMPSSTAVLVPQHQWSITNDHNSEDHNHFEDLDLSSSSPTVPQKLVLLVLAYLMDKHMIESRDFNIPSDPG